MKINIATLIAALLVAVLGVLNESLLAGVIQLPPAEQWLVPILSAVIVMVTKHIKDTGENND